MVTVSIFASIGIACYSEHSNNNDTLLKKADSVMYKAKELGNNNIQVYSEK